MILFPFTMLSTVIFGSITIPFVLLAIIQLPLYGVVFGAANLKGNLPLAGGLVMIHVAAVVACFVLIGQSFS